MTRRGRLRTSIAVMIDAAGERRRTAADWRRMAQEWPSSKGQYQSAAARALDDARWYLRRARTDLDILTGDAA